MAKNNLYCDQPHGDISFIPTYEVAKLASKEVKWSYWRWWR